MFERTLILILLSGCRPHRIKWQRSPLVHCHLAQSHPAISTHTIIMCWSEYYFALVALAVELLFSTMDTMGQTECEYYLDSTLASGTSRTQLPVAAISDLCSPPEAQWRRSGTRHQNSFSSSSSYSSSSSSFSSSFSP